MKPGIRTCWTKCPKCKNTHQLNISQFSQKEPMTVIDLFCHSCQSCSEVINQRE